MIAKTYQDLVDEIGYYELRIQQLKNERSALMSAAFGGPQGYKSNTGIEPTGIRAQRPYVSIDEAWPRIEEIDGLIKELDAIRKVHQEHLDSINNLLNNLQGRKYRVFYWRRCENKTFEFIAEQLGLSTKQAQRIYKEVAPNE